jgi:hypothetical protein
MAPTNAVTVLSGSCAWSFYLTHLQNEIWSLYHLPTASFSEMEITEKQMLRHDAQPMSLIILQPYVAERSCR